MLFLRNFVFHVGASDLLNRIQVEPLKPWNYYETIGGTNWLGNQNSFNRPVDGQRREIDRSLPHTSIVTVSSSGCWKVLGSWSWVQWNSGPINKAFIINFYFTIIIKLYDIFHFSTLARIVCHPSGMDARGRKGVRHTDTHILTRACTLHALCETFLGDSYRWWIPDIISMSYWCDVITERLPSGSCVEEVSYFRGFERSLEILVRG